MAKSKKGLNMTALIGAGALFLVSLAVMLIICLSPVSKIGTYKYKDESTTMGVTTATEFSTKFKLDGTAESKAFVTANGKIVTDQVDEAEYKIEDGKVLVKSALGWTEVEGLTSTEWKTSEDMVQTNTLAKVLKIVSIVLTSVAGLAVVAVVVYPMVKK